MKHALVLLLEGDGAEEAAGEEGGGGGVMAVGCEGVALAWARFVFEEPSGPLGFLNAVVGEGFVADEAVGPEVHHFDFEGVVFFADGGGKGGN
jgi:hypothetical protein